MTNTREYGLSGLPGLRCCCARVQKLLQRVYHGVARGIERHWMGSRLDAECGGT